MIPFSLALFARLRVMSLQQKACAARYRATHKAALAVKAAQYNATHKAQRKAYYEQNKISILDKRQRYYSENKEKVNARQCARYAADLEANRELSRLRGKLSYAKSPEKYKACAKKWRDANLEQCQKSECDRVKRAYWRNPEKFRALARKYSVENSAKRKAYVKQNRARINLRLRNRIASDPNVKLRYRISHRLGSALKSVGRTKTLGATLALLGCTIPELRAHLENQFLPGMTWENHGKFGWHLDHKRPISSYNLTDPKQQKQCFHYTNLQPMWWRDNLTKGAKYNAAD